MLRSALVPLCTALCAAVFAHVAIDVAGDHLLVRDSYDDYAHASRVFVAAAALALAASIAASVLFAALREARGSRDAFRRSLSTLLPRTFASFAAGVTAVAFGLLLVMESLDMELAGKADGDALDLFGGSLALGSTVTAISSLAFGLLAWCAVRFIARKRHVLVAFAGVFVQRRRPPLGVPFCFRRGTRRRLIRSVAYRSQCVGRAPPAFLPPSSLP